MFKAFRYLDHLKQNNIKKFADYASMQFLPFTVQIHKELHNEKFVVKHFHHRLEELLTQCAMRELDKYIVIINMPPRYSKTQMIIYYVMWCFLKNEMAKFIYATYSQKLSLKTSREIKDGLLYLGKRSAFSKTSAQLWETNKGGAMWSTTIPNGSVTGFGAGDMYCTPHSGDLILDDPNKVSDCFYENIRNHVIETFMQTFWSRRNNLDRIPIMIFQQRVHIKDLSGWILKESGLKCERYSIKALDENEESSFPERVSKSTLLDLKMASPYTFAAQQQQDPQSFGGNFFLVDRTTRMDIKQFKSIEWKINFYARSWDFAGVKRETRASEKRDYTRGVLMATDGEFVYIMNVKTHHGTVDINDTLLVTTANDDGWQVTITVPEDPGQAGQHYVDYLQNLKELNGYSLMPIRPTQNKQLRAAPFAAFLNKGKVIIVDDSEDDERWNAAFLEELASFPHSEFDDQVDCCSDAFHLIHTVNKYV